MKVVYKLLPLIYFLVAKVHAFAQCAMCKASVENNATNGEGSGLAAGLNYGILYLFFAPYIIIAVVVFFWYRSSKKNVAKRNMSLANRR